VQSNFRTELETDIIYKRDFSEHYKHREMSPYVIQIIHLYLQDLNLSKKC